MKHSLNLRTALVFIFDGIAAYAAFVFAFWLRVGMDAFSIYSEILLSSGLIFAFLAALIYRVLGVSKAVWRYASLPDLILIVMASSLAIFLWVMGEFAITRLHNIPRTIPFILWFVIISFLGGARFAYRYWREGRFSRKSAGNRTRVLIVGADDDAMLVLRNITQTGLYDCVGILDDKGTRVGRNLAGVPILETFHNIQKIFEGFSPSQTPKMILLTRPLAHWPQSFRSQLLRLSKQHDLSLAVMPAIITQPQDSQPQPIDVSQILGRKRADLTKNDIGRLLYKKRVLITGAGGSIGSELTRQIAEWKPEALALVEASEYNLYSIDLALSESAPDVKREPILLDVRDRERVFSVWQQFKPDIVFHAAALKHVPLVEMNPREGLRTNVQGTMNVADATQAVNARAMVQISTDKAVNPTNIMGASKRLAEFYAQGLDQQATSPESTRFITVRFGNVIGSSGSVIPLFQRQIERGGPVTVTHQEIKRYFMSISEAVGLILRSAVYALGRTDVRGRVLVLNMGEPKKIYDLAQDMILQAGLTPGKDIEIQVTGLRPGEKLHEELFDATESRLQTEDPALFAAEVQLSDSAATNKKITRVLKVAETGDLPAIQGAIADILKGFPFG